MDILFYLLFLLVGIGIGAVILYIWASNKYANKKNIDKLSNERNNLLSENENLKHKVKEQEKLIENLNKELESSYRELAEKNKYLSEDKVIIERLGEIKQLSDKIGEILLDYDKNTIRHLLEGFKKGEIEVENYEHSEKEKKW